MVLRWSDGTYLEDQDMWWLSGIHRDVYLYTTPNVYIQDYFIKTLFDAEYRDAVLDVEVKITNAGAASAEGCSLVGYLYDPEGQQVELENFHAVDLKVKAGQNRIAASKADVASPLKWSAETPQLYTLVLVLHDHNGMPLHIESSRVTSARLMLKTAGY